MTAVNTSQKNIAHGHNGEFQMNQPIRNSLAGELGPTDAPPNCEGHAAGGFMSPDDVSGNAQPSPNLQGDGVAAILAGVWDRAYAAGKRDGARELIDSAPQTYTLDGQNRP